MMSQISNKKGSTGLFGELFVSANKQSKITKIGIYDQGYECFDVEELRELRSYIGKLLIELQYKG